MSHPVSRWKIALSLLAAAAYAGLSHLLMVHAADAPWAVAALLGPFLIMGLAWALQRRHAPTLAVVALLVVALVWLVARGGVGSINRLYVVQHAGIHGLMFLVFARSLRKGGEALITGLARRLHSMTPAMEDYTRRVTVLWALYFLLMAIASLGAYAYAPWTVWSWLANVITPVAMAVLFVGEYLLRYRLHPEFDRTTLMDAVRAYSTSATGPQR